MVCFSSIGYKEVETPTFEYYDCYLGLSGQISQEHMFKFFDEQGRILALRPDLQHQSPVWRNKGCKFRQASALPIHRQRIQS